MTAEPIEWSDTVATFAEIPPPPVPPPPTPPETRRDEPPEDVAERLVPPLGRTT